MAWRLEKCPNCDSSNIVGLEYDYTEKERYDGVSEWVCADCNYRQGRFSGRVLMGDDRESAKLAWASERGEEINYENNQN